MIWPVPLGGDGIVPTGAVDSAIGQTVTIPVDAILQGADVEGLEVQLVVKVRAAVASSGVTLALARVRVDDQLDLLEGTRIQQVGLRWETRSSGWAKLDRETPTIRLIGRSQGGTAGGVLGATILVRERRG